MASPLWRLLGFGFDKRGFYDQEPIPPEKGRHFVLTPAAVCCEAYSCREEVIHPWQKLSSQ